VERWDEGALGNLTRYFTTLSARPSIACVIDGARRPWRSVFPLPWPEYAA
jgi:hypothetical protein